MVSITNLGIWQIGEWIVENWFTFGLITSLFILLSMTGTLTQLFRKAAAGFKEIFTPTGFIIFLILAYLIYQMYLSFKDTI